MIRLKTAFHAALLSAAALLPVTWAEAQIVETVKEYTITIEEGGDSCENLTTVGDRCGPEQDVIYVGEGVSGRKLFTTALPVSVTSWNEGNTTTSRMQLMGTRSGVNGATITAALAVGDANTAISGIQPHLAAQACANLDQGGYDDWYLPALNEAYSLYLNRGDLPLASSTIWTSTEISNYAASALNTGTGVWSATSKSNLKTVQCFRASAARTVIVKDCGTVTEIGESCGTGSVIYAGETLSGDGLFAMPFLLPATSWNDGNTTTSYMTQTNVQSGVNGETNTASLLTEDAKSNTGGMQIHSAAEFCSSLSYGGYDDWYLPASAEAHVLYRNRADLPVQSGTVWTSSEVRSYSANAFNIGTGAVTAAVKSTAYPVQCVRSGPSAVPAPTPCEGVTTPGATCGGGTVVAAGESLDGGWLYTTGFTLPAHPWNDGNTTTSYMTTTGRLSGLTGAANTAAIAALDANTGASGAQTHAAAEICASLVYGGYADWYLPASLEASELYRNRAALPVSSGTVWTSTEEDKTTASAFDLAAGTYAVTAKSTSRGVQCVRRSSSAPIATNCADVSAVGDRCGNGNVVYAGEALSGGRLFTTAAQLPAVTWNDGNTTTSYMAWTNVQSGVNGAANTAGLAVKDANTQASGTQTHVAAATCASLVYGGYSDWYLPAAHEAYELYRNRALLPVSSGTVWTSTEVQNYSASAFNIGTGALTTTTKSTPRALQCVRKEVESFTVASDCDAVTAVGQACGNGTVVYAGEGVAGEALFTTAFSLPATTWNDGNATTSYMTQTNVQSGVDGEANTTALASADARSNVSLVQTHSAAEVCGSLVYGGYDDWYLPASAEAHVLYRNRADLPVQSGTVWTSSEVRSYSANAFNIGTGAVTAAVKSTAYPVQCVRSGPSAVPAPTPCPDVTEIGGSCSSGEVIYAGLNASGDRIYTTGFTLPAHPWNDGDTRTSYMRLTNANQEMDGMANTIAIAALDANAGVSGSQTHAAAEICASLVYGGYSDWYLPAATEVVQLYTNRATLPDLGVTWTSTESTQTTAVIYNFSTGARSNGAKSSGYGVRCVRAESP